MIRRLLVPGAIVVTGVAAVATAALYIAAFSSLGSLGPNVAGYGFLAVANRAVVTDAGMLSVVGFGLAAVRGSRFVIGVLAAAAVVTFTASAGAEAIGQALADIEPTRQPLDLNSLLLALEGSGQDVLPASVLFACAAGVAFAAIRIRGSRLARPRLTRA